MKELYMFVTFILTCTNIYSKYLDPQEAFVL